MYALTITREELPAMIEEVTNYPTTYGQRPSVRLDELQKFFQAEPACRSVSYTRESLADAFRSLGHVPHQANVLAQELFHALRTAKHNANERKRVAAQ